MRVSKLVVLSILALSMGACSFLQTASISSIPKNRSKKVSAQVDRTVFLGFNFDNDYIDELPLKLARQCAKGKVRGILTKHETVSYFLVNKHVVTATGYCTKR